jgi:hypothetical protein
MNPEEVVACFQLLGSLSVPRFEYTTRCHVDLNDPVQGRPPYTPCKRKYIYVCVISMLSFLQFSSAIAT